MINELADRIVDNVSLAVKGKRRELRVICAAMLAGGHVLLEDVPGTGKTLLQGRLPSQSTRDSAGYSSPLTCCRPTSPG